MRRAWLTALEIGALVAAAFAAFILVVGTALVRWMLGAGRDYRSLCVPPGSIPWWLLGLGIAFALLAGVLFLINLSRWARIRQKGRGCLSPVLAPVLQSVFCAGAAIVMLWTLWVHFHEWRRHAENRRPEPAFCPEVSVSTYWFQIVLLVMIAGAAAGTVLFVRRAYRAYVGNHKGQPLTAKAVSRIAAAFAMATLLLVTFLSSFAFMKHLGYDTALVQCEETDWGHCLEYYPPSGGGVWLLAVVGQAAVLAGALASLGFACAPFRDRMPKRRVLSRIRPHTRGVTWVISVAVTVMIDLDKWVDQWIVWAHAVARNTDARFTYPSDEVRAGVLVASLIVLAALVFAGILLWRGRHSRVTGTSTTSEA